MASDPWMSLLALLRAEVSARREEGCDVSDLEPVVAALPESTPDAVLGALYDEIARRQPTGAWPYVEPETLDDIRSARPPGPRRLSLQIADEELADRLLGAWLGRCAGCTLGKAVEGWSRVQIRDYLERTGEYPLRDYLTLAEPIPPGHPINSGAAESARGALGSVPRDDDLDYTILGLHILDRFGAAFTTEDVAESWLTHLPYHMIYTAERVAYRNLANGLRPPLTALHRNPYREWIGAQIRADIYGYAAPGQPEVAADACG